VALFAGPYTEAGGLDLLLEAVFRLRERIPELRLAAIPHGPTHPGYRDRCEMRALELGHRGIIEWNVGDSEIPFWYAVAAVVCAPCRQAGSPEPAKRTAAAGRPFVGSDLEPFREHVDDAVTGYLVPAGDVDSLEVSLEALLGAENEAARLGDAARRKAEVEYSPAAAAKGLRKEWETVVEGRLGSAASNRRLA
jgi:glycosyltransferase involved in cell wall biosynthesis